MPSYIQEPTQVINLIADNLRDRYRDSFAIIRELMQNADDAGATQITLALSDGLAEADNPLLRPPSLVVVNDGRFTQKDARGIRLFGQSVKTIDAAAIGKFGLGQKAVFHLCEAFIYVEPVLYCRHSDAECRRDIVNGHGSIGQFHPSPSR